MLLKRWPINTPAWILTRPWLSGSLMYPISNHGQSLHIGSHILLLFLRYLFVICYLDGLHLDIEQLTSWMMFKSVKDYQIYVKRLKAVPQRVCSQCEYYRKLIGNYFIVIINMWLQYTDYNSALLARSSSQTNRWNACFCKPVRHSRSTPYPGP